jgi:phage terminase small subunit
MTKRTSSTGSKSTTAPGRNAGTSKAAALSARRNFVAHYVANGRNGTQAAISAGRSPKGANVWAARTLKEPAVQAMIEELLAQAAAITGLTIERTLLETARVAYSDPRRFFRADGSIKPMSEWTEDMAAVVASIEAEEVKTTTEGESVVTIQVKKIKFWDKNAALDKAMRHLGLFKKDDRQLSQNLAIQINLVGAPADAPVRVNAKRVP